MQILETLQKQCEITQSLDDYNRLLFTHLYGAINDVHMGHAGSTYDLGMAQATREVIIKEIKKYFET